MNAKILEKLSEIEKEHNIEVVFACESGSRAWGFASPDSDYDIRFIYKHPKDWYLKLWKQKDTIEFITEDALDGSGWDLKKALKLMTKSNASLLSWLFSPTVYKADEAFLKDIQELAEHSFNPIAGFYHYHSMSKSFLEKVSRENVRLKSFFYALRTALSATWIAKYKTIPPVLFSELLDLIDDKTKKEIEDLVEVKTKYNEEFHTKQNQRLFIFLKYTILDNDKKGKKLFNSQYSPEEFNSFFIKHIT